MDLQKTIQAIELMYSSASEANQRSMANQYLMDLQKSDCWELLWQLSQTSNITIVSFACFAIHQKVRQEWAGASGEMKQKIISMILDLITRFSSQSANLRVKLFASLVFVVINFSKEWATGVQDVLTYLLPRDPNHTLTFEFLKILAEEIQSSSINPSTITNIAPQIFDFLSKMLQSHLSDDTSTIGIQCLECIVSWMSLPSFGREISEAKIPAIILDSIKTGNSRKFQLQLEIVHAFLLENWSLNSGKEFSQKVISNLPLISTQLKNFQLESGVCHAVSTLINCLLMDYEVIGDDICQVSITLLSIASPLVAEENFEFWSELSQKSCDDEKLRHVTEPYFCKILEIFILKHGIFQVEQENLREFRCLLRDAILDAYYFLREKTLQIFHEISLKIQSFDLKFAEAFFFGFSAISEGLSQNDFKEPTPYIYQVFYHLFNLNVDGCGSFPQILVTCLNVMENF
eukprot:TRINITY_DN13497_c0_g1_i1.p1 TRINITY_DN13497_c0_g1~~TRINITY_DN13497_c0_g1_i1.p1  ORF type:complete len:461 (+),score=166.38 TRINITY_DN13497_c0_g1_i1:20-1402(+)